MKYQITKKQCISELAETVVETQAITCAVCGKMIEGLVGWDIATLAYDDGWRLSEDEPYCPKCSSEFLGDY